MNPNTVAKNRTARLVREARTPVYTTATNTAPAREHIIAVEVGFIDTGGRLWHHMPASQVDDFIYDLSAWEFFSDEDHSAKCWCQP